MNELWIIVGLPRSGKTTFVKKVMRQIGAAVVNPDAVRRAMHGQAYIQEAEDFVWATVRTMVRSLYLSGHDKVIIDACNTSRKRRDSWRYVVPENCELVLVEVQTDKDVCIERAGDNVDLVKAIKRMANNYEPVSPEEGRIEKAKYFLG